MYIAIFQQQFTGWVSLGALKYGVMENVQRKNLASFQIANSGE
jgi:hypothetical protein